MKISENFQLRSGLGEGMVLRIKPTPSPVQKPGKKQSQAESFSN